MDLEANVKCTNCGRSLEIKVKDMVPGRKGSCPHCKAGISFSGSDGRKVQGALDDLQKTLKKGINIRL